MKLLIFCFSYHDKKIDNVYKEGKKSYAQKRGMVHVPQNKKGVKLKDSIKYLEVLILLRSFDFFYNIAVLILITLLILQ